MKILYLTEIFLPHISGYTIHVDRIAKHFSKTDKVLVATSSDKFLPKNETVGNYKIVRLFSLANPFNVNTNLSYLAALKINKIIQNFKPDIIHVHDPAFISFFGSKFAKQSNIPVVYTQHANSSFPSNFMPDIFKDLMASIYQKFISKFMNENCDIIISPSKYIKQDLLNIGVKADIQIISNGVDFNIFKPTKIENDFVEKYNLWKNKLPTLLCVTRLDKDKNIDTLFAVVKKIAQQKNINIIIIGNGEKYDLFETEFESNEYVKIYSRIQPNSSDLNLFYNYSDVLLMTSTIEAQSLVTMEAMACGLPIVAYNGGALPELVKNNQNGILVYNNTPDDFVNSINKIFLNKDILNQYIEESLNLIQIHDINSSYEQIKNVYQSLLTK